MPLYRVIFKKALKISWKNKWLWFLGFFAAFLSNETIYESILGGFKDKFQAKNFVFLTKDFLGVGLFDIFQWSFIKEWWTSNSMTFTFLMLVTIAFACLLLFFIFLSVISQAGLIKSAIFIDLKKKITLKEAFQSGLEKFWQVLGLNIITKVVLFGILVLLAYLFSFLIKVIPVNAIDYILYALFVFILVFGALIIYYLTIYGTAFIVLRSKKVFESIKMAWHIFIRNILINLEMALILFGVVVVATILYVITLLILGVPLLLFYLLLSLAAAQKGMVIASVLMIVVFIVVTIIFGSWYSTFQISSYALLFEELAMKRARSKIGRVISSLRKGVMKKKKK